MRSCGVFTPSEYVVCAWRLPRSQAIGRGARTRSASGRSDAADGRRPVPGHGEADREPAVDLAPAAERAADRCVGRGPARDADPAGGRGCLALGAEAANEARLVGNAPAFGIVVGVERTAFAREPGRDDGPLPLAPFRRRRRLLDLDWLGRHP